MLNFFLSSFAFIIAGYFIRRYLDDIGVPRGISRSVIVFVLALAVAYGVGFLVDEAVALVG
jgi:hypothetical protein